MSNPFKKPKAPAPVNLDQRRLAASQRALLETRRINERIRFPGRSLLLANPGGEAGTTSMETGARARRVLGIGGGGG